VSDSVIPLLPWAVPLPGSYAEPASRVRILHGWLTELGLPEALSASRRLLTRAEDVEGQARQEQIKAQQRHTAAYRGLVAGEVTIGELAAELAADSVWLDSDVPGGQPAPMMAALMRASADMRAHAAALLEAEGSGIYRQLQDVAQEIVGTVAAEPPLPQRVWSSADPAAECARAGREETWGVFTRAADRWATLHRAGDLLRRVGGLGAQAQLTVPAPEHLAWAWRRWWLALDGLQEWRRLAVPLRLRWSIDHGWQPGLYLRDDVPAGPEDDQPGRGGLLGRLLGRD
jgi:hypothetical protein